MNLLCHWGGTGHRLRLTEIDHELDQAVAELVDVA